MSRCMFSVEELCCHPFVDSVSGGKYLPSEDDDRFSIDSGTFK